MQSSWYFILFVQERIKYCCSRQFPKMDASIYIHLIILSVVNVFFMLTGITLNSLVLLSFWKTHQLRKKLCHYTIMLLSYFDLLAAMTNHSIQTAYSAVWLIENYQLLSKLKIYLDISKFFLGCSLLSLLVMSLERYLSIAHPVFHRVSVSKRKLVVFLVVAIFLYFILALISSNNLAISGQIGAASFFSIITPPFLFFNYKLFKMSRKFRKNASTPKVEISKKLKSISSCLLAVACYVILVIPTIIFIVLSVSTKATSTNVRISWLWTKTIISMNSTFNCLIFFWKNNILCTEAIKVINMLKFGKNR